MKEIRTLTAAEIDCRVGQVSRQGNRVSILLYKNARVDMAMLDELVGPANWQRDHKEIKGNLYCGVGIFLENGWTWKWDCGVESNTEKEKGEASDSFKRACVNWGIGRELYTAPRIWITCTDKEWNDGRPYVDLHVSTIEYNDAREIVVLEIKDGTGKVRYQWRDGTRAAAPAAAPAQETAPAPATKGKKIFCPEKYPVAWNSALEKARTTGDITRLDIEDQGFTVTAENWKKFQEAVNS